MRTALAIASGPTSCCAAGQTSLQRLLDSQRARLGHINLLTYYYAMQRHGNVFTSAENASRAFAVTLFPKSSSGRL